LARCSAVCISRTSSSSRNREVFVGLAARIRIVLICVLLLLKYLISGAKVDFNMRHENIVAHTTDCTFCEVQTYPTRAHQAPFPMLWRGLVRGVLHLDAKCCKNLAEAKLLLLFIGEFLVDLCSCRNLGSTEQRDCTML